MNNGFIRYCTLKNHGIVWTNEYFLLGFDKLPMDIMLGSGFSRARDPGKSPGKSDYGWWTHYMAYVCLSLRVENRPSVLGIFLYVPWGGVGWGGAITFTYLRPPMMLRHGKFTCTCAHTSCYVEDVSRHAGVGWGGVGWGHNVHVLAHSHDVTPRHVHLHVRTYVMLRWRCVTSCRGGVWWGGAITFTYLRTPMMLRHGTFTCTCAHTSCKCSWKSPVVENRCVLSEDL